MNYLDIAILVVLGLFILKGWLKGFLKELCTLIGLVAGAFLAFRFHGPLAEWMNEIFGLHPQIWVAVAYLALFLATLFFFALVGFLLSRFVKLLFMGGFNRVAGAFFGLFQGALLLAIVLFALSLSPLPKGLEPTFKNAELVPPFIRLGELVLDGSRHLVPNWR